jgi:tetratricopeptide (TPR) repeat protein
MLAKWGMTEADLRAAAREIQQRLKQLHVKNRYLPAAKDQAIKRLLTQQLNNSGIEQAKENPSFFEGYQNVLSELAEHNPLEAVKAAEDIADALFDLQDSPQQAREVLDRVETFISKAQNGLSEEVKFRLLLQRLNIYRAFGLTRQAVDLINEVEANQSLLDSLDSQLKAAWYTNLGLIQCWVKNDYENALHSLKLAQKYNRLSGQWKNEAGVLADIGLIYWNQGELVRAEEALLASRAQALQLGGYRSLLKIIGNLGLVYLYQGKVNEAYGYIEEHFRLAGELGHLKERRRARGNRGITKFHLGDYAAAIEDLEEDIRSLKVVNEGTLHAAVNLSRCYIACGNVEYGCELASWSLEQAREKRYVNIEIIALRALAECMPPEEAEALLRQALNAARGKRRIDEAACLLSQAKLTRDPKLHEDYWQEGVKILDEMGAQAWLKDDALHLPTL